MTTQLELLRHLSDFGMVVVLWLVQLVIYPSFLSVQPDHLQDWHATYTFRVSFIIMPLMLMQLALVGWMAFHRGGVADAFALLLIATCWALTFGVSVPLHRRIAKGQGCRAALQRLIQTNWPRTIFWTAALGLGFLSSASNG